jgi:hypothetical protein
MEMTITIITAIISGLCVAIPSIIATITANRKDNALVKYRIDELDSKVNKHNNLIERTFKIEERLSVIEEKIRNL